MGNRLDFQVFQPEAVVTARGMERMRFHPWGVFGGLPGRRGRAILNPETSREHEIGKINVLRVETGDVVSIRTPGGGGFGEPLERDPLAVRDDVLNDIITLEVAENAYGVVFRGRDVDVDATIALRAARLGGNCRETFNYGGVRDDYERQWGAAAATTLSRLLMSVAPSMRSYAKRRVHQHLADVNVIDPGDVRRAWAELQKQLGVAWHAREEVACLEDRTT